MIKGEKSQENSSYKLVVAVPKLSSMQTLAISKMGWGGVEVIVCTTQAARALAVFVGKESQQDHSQ